MKLPSAPLLEVIFEFQWHVVRTDEAFGYDPGFGAFASSFEEAVGKAGFKEREVTAQPGPIFANKVALRYRQKGAFPLLQIGPGIFACNISTDYEWPAFLKLIGEGVANVFKHYPDTPITPLVPRRLELRYIDVFSQELLGHASWEKFITDSTNMKFSSLAFLNEISDGADQASLRLRYPLKDEELGFFHVDVSSGRNADKPSLLLTSRVIRNKFPEGVPERSDLQKQILSWATKAHDQVTHTFFKKFVSKELMAKFEGGAA